jgi:hypothetical protein
MKPVKRRLRLDMIITEIEIVDKEKGIFRFKAIPDPRVWEKKIVNGEEGYWHKLDNIFLSEKELAKAVPTLKNKPIYLETVGIKNKEKYLRRSKERIEERAP